jgi:hypothetical protein
VVLKYSAGIYTRDWYFFNFWNKSQMNYTKRLRKARENGKRAWSWNSGNVFGDGKAAGGFALYVSPIIDKKWK